MAGCLQPVGSPNSVGHRGGEEAGDIPLGAQRQAGVLVLVGFAPVDNDIRHTPLGGSEGDGGGRVYREGGPQGDCEIRGVRGVERSAQVALVEFLAEADRGWLQKTAAVAPWGLASVLEVLEMWPWILALPATLALDCRVGAVDFHEFFG